MVRQRSLALVAATCLLAGLLSANSSARAVGPLDPPPATGPVKAGYGEADATWHVGAGAGQYTRKRPEGCLSFEDFGKNCDPRNAEYDPHAHSTREHRSYGVQSRLSYRAIVVEDSSGDQVAFVKSDSYLAQDALARRVAQILTTELSDISYDEIFHMASHNHSSPYYMTPSWGVWLFQDAFDIRAFEYHARAMANAILKAEDNLVAARMGATEIEHKLFKGMVARRTTADDGTPVGYPLDFGDFGLSVIRFEEASAPHAPIAAMINWGQHPEGLDDHDLITGDFVAPLERFVERATGAPLVFGQGDVGSAEAGPGHPEEVAALGIPARWSHAGHAQAERGAWLLAQDVVKAWDAIGDGVPVDEGDRFVPFSSNFDVKAGNAFVPGPLSHPYPSVSNCRSEPTVKGDTGAPILGLPDCERGSFVPDHPFGDQFGMFWDLLQGEGIPVPAHYDAPGFTGVEENLRMKLQAFKLGDVILMSCACEAQVDLILNLESRVDKVAGNIHDGYDWTERLNCVQDEVTTEWTCTRWDDDPARPSATFTEPLTFSNDAYLKMLAQVHNDAGARGGWDAPQNAVHANTDPDKPEEIWGNFTKTELAPAQGYELPIGVGHAGDYNGYTVSYREYMAYDHYRKALTSYGPHTADYMNTRLMKLAGEANGAAEDPIFLAERGAGTIDEARQLAATTALGGASLATWEVWTRAIPMDVGPEKILKQPEDVEKFNAATVKWRGGSNAVDNPIVTVERLKEDGSWELFADQSGEIQTKLQFPEAGLNAFFDTYSGAHEWEWTANFEAFDALPAGIGSTPPGKYRFVIEGHIRDEDAAPLTSRRYRLTSREFAVRPWDGISVSDISSDGSSFSFVVDPIVYPKTYESEFPYIKSSGKTPQGDEVIKTDELGRAFCTTCTFRPWASSAKLAAALVTIVHPDGGHSTVEATCDKTTQRCAVPLKTGETAFIQRGAVTDTNGEINGQCYSANDGNECPPEPNDRDSDDDGVLNDSDNCPAIANADQSDRDDDGIGDLCDSTPDGDPQPTDSDGDGTPDGTDNCPAIANDQTDGDGDGVGDACDDDPPTEDPNDEDGDGHLNAADNCPGVANSDQSDRDNDGSGDACDSTPDGPPAPSDADGDGVADGADNCPGIANSDQADNDSDSSGNACDDTPNGTQTGGSGGGDGSGGGSGGGSSSSSPPPSATPTATATPSQSAAGDERGTVGSSIAANKTAVDYRKPVTLSGQVEGDRTCATTNVEILGRTFGTTEFVPVGTADVGADGMWSTTVRSARSTAYAARPVDNELCEGQLSATLDVLVRARVTATVRKRCDARHAINGRVAPAYPGTVVKLKDKRAGRWVTVDKAKLSIKSRFHFPRCTGTRVVWPKQDPRNETGRGPVLTSVTIS